MRQGGRDDDGDGTLAFKKKEAPESLLEKENKERVEESQCCRERRGVRSIRGSF